MECLRKNERVYRFTAKNKRFLSLLILLLSVASIRRKLLKTNNTEERSVQTNSESLLFSSTPRCGLKKSNSKLTPDSRTYQRVKNILNYPPPAHHNPHQTFYPIPQTTPLAMHTLTNCISHLALSKDFNVTNVAKRIPFKF